MNFLVDFLNKSDNCDNISNNSKIIQINRANSSEKIHNNNNKLICNNDENLNTETNFFEEEFPKFKRPHIPLEATRDQNKKAIIEEKQKKTVKVLSVIHSINSSRNLTIIRKETLKPKLINCWEFLSNSSCFCFYLRSKIRIAIGKLIGSKVWDYFILCNF